MGSVGMLFSGKGHHIAGYNIKKGGLQGRGGIFIAAIEFVLQVTNSGIVVK